MPSKLFKFGIFRKKKNKSKSYKNNGSQAYENLTKVQVSVDQLSVGMYVSELDKPWLESSFMFQGFEIKDEKTIEQIKNECLFVYIDQTKQSKGKKSKIGKGSAPANSTEITYNSAEKPLSSVEKEINKTEAIITDSRHLVANFMDKIADGKGVDVVLAKQAVSDCVNSVLHSPDAVLWLLQLKNKHEYTAQHSMNVCALSIVLGRQVNLSVKELNQVGLCGMMHDMGKMLIPPEVIDKPGRLDDDEMRIMQSHTTLGYELLRSSDNMFEGAVETAFNHHERLDKKGYPRKIPAESISKFTRIVAIADMYDAITSDRVYQKGRTHLEATKIMTDIAGLHLDSQLVIKFIESLGVYPPGAFVKMTNDEIAVIVEINPEKKLRPKIIIVRDREGAPVPEKVIDLATLPVDLRGELYTIKGIVHAAAYDIDSAHYYQKGVLQKGFSSAK